MTNAKYGGWLPRIAITTASLATTGLGVWYLAEGQEPAIQWGLVGVALALGLFGMSAGKTAWEWFQAGDYVWAIAPALFAILVATCAYAVSSSGTQRLFQAGDDAQRVAVQSEALTTRKLDAADERVGNAKAALPELKASQAAAVDALEAAKAETKAADARRLAPDACDNARHRPNDANPNCQARTTEWQQARAAETDAAKRLVAADAALAKESAELKDAEAARAELLGGVSGPVAQSGAALVGNASWFTRFFVNYILNAAIDFGAMFGFMLTSRPSRDPKDRPVTMADLKAIIEERGAPQTAPQTVAEAFRAPANDALPMMTGKEMSDADDAVKKRNVQAYQALQGLRTKGSVVISSQKQEAATDATSGRRLNERATQTKSGATVTRRTLKRVAKGLNGEGKSDA